MYFLSVFSSHYYLNTSCLPQLNICFTYIPKLCHTTKEVAISFDGMSEEHLKLFS